MSSLARARPHPAIPWLPSRLRISRLWVLAVALLLLVGSAPSAYLVNTSGAITTGYNIQRLQAERATWEVRNQQLELELAKARSLAWIEVEAVNRLGMRRPSQQTVVRVDAPLPSSRTQTRSLATLKSAGRPAAASDNPSSAGPGTAVTESWPEKAASILAKPIAGP